MSLKSKMVQAKYINHILYSKLELIGEKYYFIKTPLNRLEYKDTKKYQISFKMLKF